MSEHAPTLDPIEESRMTLMEHLIELRSRLIWISGALIVGTMISFYFFRPMLEFLASTAQNLGLVLQIIGPTDSISIIFHKFYGW